MNEIMDTGYGYGLRRTEDGYGFEVVDVPRIRKASRQHPAEVTAGRLGRAVEMWGDQFAANELDMIGMIIHRLDEIAENSRGRNNR